MSGRYHEACLCAAACLAYFADEVPGFIFGLGTPKQGTVSGPHHSPTFRADDDSVVVGVRVMSNLILDYLSGASE